MKEAGRLQQPHARRSCRVAGDDVRLATGCSRGRKTRIAAVCCLSRVVIRPGVDACRREGNVDDSSLECEDGTFREGLPCPRRSPRFHDRMNFALDERHFPGRSPRWPGSLDRRFMLIICSRGLKAGAVSLHGRDATCLVGRFHDDLGGHRRTSRPPPPVRSPSRLWPRLAGSPPSNWLEDSRKREILEAEQGEICSASFLRERMAATVLGEVSCLAVTAGVHAFDALLPAKRPSDCNAMQTERRNERSGDAVPNWFHD